MLDDVESGETMLQEERTDHVEEDHSSGLDVSALPGHMDHHCTNWIWIFILPLALSALYFPVEKAIHEGDVTKFFRGFDYYGRMCGRDLCDGVKCGPFTYYCGKTLDEMPDTAHPICVDSCPTGNSTSHICWDEDSLSTVSLPDLPTEEFNMKCLQLAHVQKEHEKKNAKLFKGLEDFKGAGSLVGLLMDSLHSVKRAWTILILTFFVALATGTFYMVFLKFLAAFLIYVSLSLMTIIPFVFGAFHIIKVFTSGGFGEVLGGNTEVQTSFLSGIGGICVAFVLCCTLTKISQGVATATGCIVATTDCMFSIPSILFEPLVSITLKASIAGPMVYLGVMLVSTGQMVLLMGNDEMHRTVSLQGEQWVYLAYVVFMCLWLVEITHNGTQYVLAYVTERWYFTPFVEDVKVDIPHPCIVLEAIFNMFRYHLGSVILSAFLKTLFRVPKIISFTLYLVGCCDHRRKRRDPEEKLNKCSCRLLMKLLRKEGYMDMAITSSEYCLATQHAMFTLEDSSAELVLNWTQLIFQVGGWALTTAMSALFATVMVSTPKYTDPLGSHYLTQPESVIMVCGVLGFSTSVSFMNVFDVVGDTILYCFALEEQRHRQQNAGKYDPYDEQSIFQRCCRTKNSDGFMSWLLGYEDEKADDYHRGHTQKVQYAPRSLLDAMEAAK